MGFFERPDRGGAKGGFGSREKFCGWRRKER
jgi:hypothetical protein